MSRSLMADSSPMDDELSKFLADYPTKLHYKRCKPYDTLMFWSQNDETSPDGSSVHEKILSALGETYLHHAKGLIQFWAPDKIGSGRLLTTFDQPFSLCDLEKNSIECRLSSLECKYDIDNLEVQKNPKILSSAPARAFLNRFPEIVTLPDGCPRMGAALESGFIACLVLPFFSDSSQNCCIGVLEYYAKDETYMIVLEDLNDALKDHGLYPFDGEEHISSKNICGLVDAKNEIIEALQVVVGIHRVDIGQAWTAYEDENHVAITSSLDGIQNKRMFGFKLTTCETDSVDYDGWYLYDNIPLVDGMGLVERTFRNTEAQFSADFPVDDIIGDTQHCCFTICLKNNTTRDLLYVLEFIWAACGNYISMLEPLVLTLKRCLPSFNLTSGTRLGAELRVIDVDYCSGNEFFKILEENKSSSKRLSIEESKGKTVEKRLPVEKIDVSESTLKRKWRRLVNSECPGLKWQKRNTLDMKVEYGDKVIRFGVPDSSTTLKDVEKKIKDGFSKDPGTYKLKYCDENMMTGSD